MASNLGTGASVSLLAAVLLFATSVAEELGYLAPAMLDTLAPAAVFFLGVLAIIVFVVAYEKEW